MLKLYDYFRSSACFRVRIALNIKGLEYDLIPIHLINQGGEHHASAYKALNPQELVPTLVDGNEVLTQSIAIIEYLDEVYPSQPIMPKKAYERALVRAFALAIVADIHPLNNLRVLGYLSNELKISEEQKQKWYQHWVMKGLSALETKMASLKPEKFCFGDFPSLADICLVPQLFNAKRFKCDLNLYPNLVRIDKECEKLSAFKEAYPCENPA